MESDTRKSQGLRNKSCKVIIALASIFIPVAAYGVGVISGIQGLWPIEEIRQFKRSFSPVTEQKPQFDQLGRLTSFPGKTEIPCPAQDGRTVVLLAIGQSNMSNAHGQRYASGHGDKVINYFHGKCFVAASPLLGTTGVSAGGGAFGAGGESLTLLGNKLIESGYADRVILVPSAMGGRQIRYWRAGAELNGMLMSVIDDVKPHYTVTQILWHQGEADFDVATPSDEYLKSFVSLVDSIRNRGVEAPVFLSVATRCWVDPRWSLGNPLAVAQKAFVDSDRKIFHGVDSDAMMGPLDRWDDCHFSGSGQEKFASAWANVITAFH